MIDKIDKKILTFLQDNARITNAQIGREMALAPSGIHERIKKMENKGIITGYQAIINPKKVGLGVTAFIFIRSIESPGETEAAKLLAEVDEIEEVHHIAGEDCYLIKIRAKDNEDLARLLQEKIGTIEQVKYSRTSIVLKTTKENGKLSL